VANDGAHGRELWRSNASGDALSLAFDLRPGDLSSNPSDLVSFNNAVYFSADNTDMSGNGVGRELWALDVIAIRTAAEDWQLYE
jgi:ELWxxDGT repeat protein